MVKAQLAGSLREAVWAGGNTKTKHQTCRSLQESK